MGQTQGVTELVGGHLEEIGATRRANGPQFRVIKVGIAAKDREEGVGQSAALAIEGIAITMLALHEPGKERNLKYIQKLIQENDSLDFDMHWSRGLPGEGQVCVLGPHSKGASNLRVDIHALQPLGVLGDLVGEVLHAPPASLQGVPLGPALASAHAIPHSAAGQGHQLLGLLVQLAGDVQARKALELLDGVHPGLLVMEPAAGRIAG